MTRRGAFVGIAALAFVAGGARAQERQLRDADIPRLIPLLRTEAAGVGAAQAYSERQLAARTSFSGDPLEWFRGRAKVDLPEGASYEAGCSRAASAGGPVAIFTFGRNIDCQQRILRDYARTLARSQNETLPPPPPMSQACRSEGEQTSKFLEGVRSALEQRGFSVVEAGDLYSESGSADGNLRVFLHPQNTYDRANRLEDHPVIRIENEQAREAVLAACSAIPSGPILELLPGDRAFEKEPLDSLDTALKKAGLTTSEYEAMKEALFLARMHSQPEWSQAAEAAAGTDPAARQALTIRRANADLYRKHASELRPLLDALMPGM